MSGFEIALIIGAVLGVLVLIGRETGKTRDLREAASGSTRIETVKSNQVAQLERRYRKHGWQAVNQSTAKSFGTKARVTITFKKP